MTFGQGFEAGEAYRNKQTTLQLDDPAGPCIHHQDREPNCATYGIPCDNNPEKGCFMSVELRNALIGPRDSPVQIPEPDLSIRDQSANKISVNSTPPIKRRKPSRLSVRVSLRIGHYSGEWIEFRCQCFRPRGAEPDYVRGTYNNDSSDCAENFKVVNGVKYTAPFYCRRESHGSESWPDIKLPDLHHDPKHELAAIRNGLVLLFPKVTTKKVKKNG